MNEANVSLNSIFSGNINFSIGRKRTVFSRPKMCSSAAVFSKNCQRGQVHLQPRPQPRRPQVGGHHMSHVETSANSGGLGRPVAPR